MAVNQSKWLMTPIRGLILDITGVLKDSDVAIKGSVEAVNKLQNAKFPFCLVSNESTSTRANLCEKLCKMGYNISESKIITPIPVVVEILKQKNLRPHLLVRNEVLPEFEGVNLSDPNCVVMADAFEGFTYSNLNLCFQKLLDMENPIFFSLGIGKYYKDNEGLALDVGAFAKGLEYASGVKVQIVGKPEPDYFLTAVKSLGLLPEEVVMVGDDIEFDVGGAQTSGLRGILVRTGKYLESCENHKIKPDAIVDNLLEAVDLVLASHQ